MIKFVHRRSLTPKPITLRVDGHDDVALSIADVRKLARDAKTALQEAIQIEAALTAIRQRLSRG